MFPEIEARNNIDSMLAEAGWIVQGYAQMNLGAGPGIAVREFPLQRGYGTANYLLYVNRRAVGVIEAKKVGESLAGVEVQTEKYSAGLPANLPSVVRPLPFLYQSIGEETRFTDARDPDCASRDVFSFPRPETLAVLASGFGGAGSVSEDRRPYTSTLLSRLRNMPGLVTTGMRDCQIEAITNLERSLAQGRRRSLLQMQTGSGKTYTAVASTYRLIKHASAKRILFLVDRGNLGKQTLKEFQQYVTPDEGRKFTELYNVQLLTSNKIDPVAKVVITTIQRFYAILQGRDEDDPVDEEVSLGGLAALQKEPLPVIYQPHLPVEFFDFVWTDECHRSIYNHWRGVLKNFEASLIGLVEHYVCQSVALIHRLRPALASYIEIWLANEENGQRMWQKYTYGQGVLT